MVTSGDMTEVQLPPIRPDLNILLDAALSLGGEPDAFDFKETLDPRTEEHKIRLLRAIGAFGNTDGGGHLFIGIRNDRTLVGVSDEIANLYDQTPIQKLVNQQFAPAPTIQVRQHQRDGKRLVIIEIAPFREIPCVVTKTVRAGKEFLFAGTILFRNKAAESAALTTELDMRQLCDAIANRRAQSITEILQRGLVGLKGSAVPSPARFMGLPEARERADRYWPSVKAAPPYIEVFFAPEKDFKIKGAELRRVFPATSVPIRDGFPFHDVFGGPVDTSMPWGWFGAIPFSKEPDPAKMPSNLWMLGRNATFLYREDFWEDLPRSSIPNGVSIFHVAGLLVMLIRFLDRLAQTLAIEEETIFTVGVALNNVQGRYLEDERRGSRWNRPLFPEARAEASLEERLGRLRSARTDVVVNLLEEIVWLFGAPWQRQNLVQVVNDLRLHLGPAYTFPENEKVEGL